MHKIANLPLLVHFEMGFKNKDSRCYKIYINWTKKVGLVKIEIILGGVL